MKNFIKVICVSVLTFASLVAVAKPVQVSLPPVPVTTTSVVPSGASGYWYSQQVPGLKVALVAGNYFAGNSAYPTCGKVLKVTVSVPRVAPTNGWVHAEGYVVDSTNTGVAFGYTFNLLTKAALAGTFSVVSYDPTNNYLTIQLNTSAGGPTGTYVLSRDVFTPYTALIVPNCQ